MEDKKTEFRIINLNESYNPRYDELFVNARQYVTWGEDNMYPYYLIKLLNKSAKHRAIVETKASMVGGNGWNIEGADPNMINFIKNKYSKDDLNTILKKVALDYEVLGSFCLNVIWSKDRQTISRIEYIDTSKVRVHYDTDTNIDGYLVCDDWMNIRKFKPVLYTPFSITDRGQASQILYVKNYSPGCDYYSVPTYVGGVNWIELEYEISNFHLSSVKNGFSPGMVVNFSQGIPSNEEMTNVVSRLKSEYAGASNGGKVLITFSDGKDNAPIITPISLNDSDERFTQLNAEVTEGILCAHQVTNPTLFGIKTPGELGGSKDILDALNVMKSQYIIPRQKLIEDTFNRLSVINGLQPMKINEFNLDLDVQIVPSDIIGVLTSPLSSEQKRIILEMIGVTPTEATKLTEENKNIS